VRHEHHRSRGREVHHLRDPNGIGLELTVELPERVKSVRWPSTEEHPEIIDAEGRTRQGLEPLDVDAVLAKLPAGELPNALPTGTRIGHLHLKVADLEAAYSFYRDRLGLLPNNYVPVIGYGELGTGDTRIHRLAVNTWEGAGVPRRPAGAAGLNQFTMRLGTRQRLNDVLGRLEDMTERDGGHVAGDPDGNAFEPRAPARGLLVEPKSPANAGLSESG
jgi:catechol 2,3-dioxygenase